MIDQKSDEEPNAIDQILNQKLQSDIDAQAVQTGVSVPPLKVGQVPTTDEKKLDQQARAIALANIEAAQKKAALEREAKAKAEEAKKIAHQKAIKEA